MPAPQATSASADPVVSAEFRTRGAESLMSKRCTQWAAAVERGPIRRCEHVQEPLTEGEVEVAPRWVGVCHSDLHLLDGDWGKLRAPFVPGHEVVGDIVAVGPGVDPNRIGRRVGVGWLAGSCGRCRECARGWQNLCREKVETCVGRPGGLATSLRVQSGFAFDIPDALASEHAAPLLCAGATVWGALKGRGIGAGDRVAVVGLGGLGHLAIPLAKALGADVAAVSRSADKEEDAARWGATQFLTPEALFRPEQRGRFDLILQTAPAAFDAGQALRSLAPRGAVVFAGAHDSTFAVRPGLLISKQRVLTGVEIAPPAWIAELLEFSAQHGVRPTVELGGADDADAVFDKLRAGEVRYRAVLRIPVVQ